MPRRCANRGRPEPSDNALTNDMERKYKTQIEQLMQMNANLLATLNQLMQNQNSLNANQTPVTSAAAMTEAIDQKRPSTFNGKGDPIKLLNWIQEFDKIFETLECPEELRVGCATFYLVEEADTWWITVKGEFLRPEVEIDHHGNPTERVPGWDAFKTALRNEFFPAHLKRQKMSEFNSFRQGQLSVQEYYNKFLELAKLAPELVPTEESRAIKFEEGLDIEIQYRLGAESFTSLRDVLGRAFTEELSVQEYYNKFLELAKLAPELVPTEESRAIKFEEGLDIEIQDVLGRAFTEERHLNLRKELSGVKRKILGSSQENFKRSNVGNQVGRATPFNDPRNFRAPANQSRGVVIHDGLARKYFCKRCNNNHPGKDCLGNPITCFICGKARHRAFECFQRQSSQPTRFSKPNPSSSTASAASNTRFQGRSSQSQGSQINRSRPQTPAQSNRMVNTVQMAKDKQIQIQGNMATMNLGDAEENAMVMTGLVGENGKRSDMGNNRGSNEK